MGADGALTVLDCQHPEPDGGGYTPASMDALFPASVQTRLSFCHYRSSLLDGAAREAFAGYPLRA